VSTVKRMRRLVWAQVRARRLERHSLGVRLPAHALVDVARATCGIHAQVQASAELQLATRVREITQKDVRTALWETRSLVKAWTLRGTLHLHPADELPLWLAAARTGEQSQELPAWTDPKGAVHPALGSDAVSEIRAAALAALDGRCLLREELAIDVVRQVGAKVGSRLRSGFAFFGGAELCQGPPQGNKITLTRADQWIEGWKDVDEVEALREACRRYLQTYGPASPADFRTWLRSRSFEPADARALFESLDDELEEVDVEGHRGFLLAGDTRFPDAHETVRLLPEYDVYVMGFREREHLVPEAVRAQVAAYGRGRYEGPAGVRFVMMDGVCAGVWQRKKRGKRIELTVEPAEPLTRASRRALEDEARRFGDFLGLEPTLELGSRDG
jgi:Winged helix DNA-binding domain